jgi:hypothetical protein
MTAASPGGPRYDPSLTQKERGEISNAIFLCAVCADVVDKNNGLDLRRIFYGNGKGITKPLFEGTSTSPFIRSWPCERQW